MDEVTRTLALKMRDPGEGVVVQKFSSRSCRCLSRAAAYFLHPAPLAGRLSLAAVRSFSRSLQPRRCLEVFSNQMRAVI